MSKLLQCSICGKEYDDLAAYMNCVSACYKKAQKEKEEAEAKKKMEEIDTFIKDIKDLKHKLNELKSEFCRKYPKEYELNFGELTCNEESEYKDDNKSLNDLLKTIEVSLVNDGKDQKVDAKINGKKVNDDILKEIIKDPEIKYLSQLLKLL